MSARRGSYASRIVCAAAAMGCVAALDACPSARQLDHRETAIFDDWLVCVDCDHQLDSVRAIAARKAASAVAMLSQALDSGPPAASVSDSDLGLTYARDSSWLARHAKAPLTLLRPAFVTAERQRFAGGYQARAAVGLGWIHDSAAVRALHAALALPLAPAVRSAVQYAIDSLPK